MDPEVIRKIAENKIQEAIEEGKFDDLPGKGKPLVFEEDYSTPPHLRMVNRILKNAGVLPEWVQVQKDIALERDEAAKFRARIMREGHARFARLQARPIDHTRMRQFTEWRAVQRDAYLVRLKQINTSILKFSMLAPSTAPAFRSIKLDAEMAAFDADLPPPDLP